MRTLIIALLLSASVQATYTTPTVQPKTPIVGDDGRIYIVVVYTGDSGEKPLQQSFYGVSFPDLQAQIYAFMGKLNTVASDVGQVKLQPGQVVPAPGSVVVTPPTQTDEQKFFLDLLRLYGLKRAIAADVFAADDPNYAALLKQVQQEFQSSYVNDNNWIIQ